MRLKKWIIPILFGVVGIFLAVPLNVAAGDEIDTPTTTQTITYQNYLIEVPAGAQVIESKVVSTGERTTIAHKWVEIKMVYELYERVPRTIPARVFDNNKWLTGTLTVESQSPYSGKWHVVYSGWVSE